MNKQNSKEHGLINPLIVIAIVLSVFTVGLGAFSVWAYINYQDYKNNTDSKISAATSEAKSQQSEQDEKDFLEREKQPTKQLVGPTDLGRVSFSYPKTWSVYIGDNGSKGAYEAYLHPGSVPPLNSKTPYALRVSIVDSTYEKELAGYKEDIESGDYANS